MRTEIRITDKETNQILGHLNADTFKQEMHTGINSFLQEAVNKFNSITSDRKAEIIFNKGI